MWREKKSERGSLLTLCVFSWVWSHTLGINAQHGTAILPVDQRPRKPVSQPLPFSVPCPRSETQLSPHQLLFRCLTLFSNFCYSRCSTVWAPVPVANPFPSPWHRDSERTMMRTRRTSGERSTGGGGGGGEDNSSGPEITTAVTAALSFQHLFHAECSGRSVHGMGTAGLTLF